MTHSPITSPTSGPSTADSTEQPEIPLEIPLLANESILGEIAAMEHSTVEHGRVEYPYLDNDAIIDEISAMNVDDPIMMDNDNDGDSQSQPTSPVDQPVEPAPVKSEVQWAPSAGRWDNNKPAPLKQRTRTAMGKQAQQVQKKIAITELRADGSRVEFAMRMRELMGRLEAITMLEPSQSESLDVLAQAAAAAASLHPARPRRMSSDIGQEKQNNRNRNAVHARDLRAIDTSYAHNCQNPAIVVRQHVVIVNFHPLRVVITWNRMLVLGVEREVIDDIAEQLARISEKFGGAIPRIHSQDALSVASASDLAHNNTPAEDNRESSLSEEQGGEVELVDGTKVWRYNKPQEPYAYTEDEEAEPFELRALEAVLAVTTRRLEAEADSLVPGAQAATYFMRSARMSLDHLERLRKIKNAVSFQETRARDTAEAIRATLDDDEDMCMMQLSLMREQPSLFDPPMEPDFVMQHDDVELILESYLQETEAVQTKLELLRLSIDNAEDLFTMRLDIARNRLITADTIFTLFSMIMATGALVTGFFGMNLKTGGESFVLVTVLTVVLCVCASAALFLLLVRSNTLVF